MTDTEYAGMRMSELSRWIDEGNANRMAVMTREELERELSMSLRIAKAAEEIGEAVSALIGFTGQNPRKGIVNTLQDINKELMDVAITALGAYESINDNPGDALQVLEAAIVMVADRALAAGEPVVEAAIELGYEDSRVEHDYRGNSSGLVCWVGQHGPNGMCGQPEGAH